jgi:hypothetical protein
MSMTYEKLKNLSPREFKRLCEVHYATSERMVEVLKPHLERTIINAFSLPRTAEVTDIDIRSFAKPI